MFWGDWSGVDVDASIQKYADAVMSQVSSRYPDASVSVNVFQAEPDVTLAPRPRRALIVEGYPQPASEHIDSDVAKTMTEIWNDRPTWIVNK